MTDNTNQKILLQAAVRETFGKSVRKMRKDGQIPANIFGPKFESKAISVNAQEFNTIYKQAGETGVIYIEFEKESIPTLVTDIQFDPTKGNFIHVDFRKVDLNKKIEANVPFTFIGESEAVKTKNGVLLTQMDEVTVEALPANIPHQIEVDLTALQEIGDAITVAQLPTSDKYAVTADPELVVVSVTEHKEESIEPETVTEAPEITTEKPEEEGATEEQPGESS
ncbi:MAG TPA: 50S ribosomal protein L25 [Candidatus Woesebacteria bacterium]|nr:50S ribosomal protein L25 [Candidatus Woesebacteria bacterium]